MHKPPRSGQKGSETTALRIVGSYSCALDRNNAVFSKTCETENHGCTAAGRQSLALLKAQGTACLVHPPWSDLFGIFYEPALTRFMGGGLSLGGQ